MQQPSSDYLSAADGFVTPHLCTFFFHVTKKPSMYISGITKLIFLY